LTGIAGENIKTETTMNKFLITGFVILLSVTSCLKDLLCINGNSDLQTESRDAEAFSAILNVTAVDVIYHKADSTSITVKAESNLIPHISTKTSDGRLEIRTDPKNACLDYNVKPVITISSPELNNLELTGSGTITADTLSGSTVSVKLTGSGDIRSAYISAGDFSYLVTGSGNSNHDKVLCLNADFTITGSGDLNVKGNCTNAKMKITGSGDIKTGDFKVSAADDVISGSGNITTYVEDILTASITGSGNIYLSGNPQVSQTITGSGRIIKQ
jgi:hypothetical protein